MHRLCKQTWSILMLSPAFIMSLDVWKRSGLE